MEYQDLVEHLKKQLQKGTPEQLREFFIQEGFEPKLIDRALADAKSQISSTTKPAGLGRGFWIGILLIVGFILLMSIAGLVWLLKDSVIISVGEGNESQKIYSGKDREEKPQQVWNPTGPIIKQPYWLFAYGSQNTTYVINGVNYGTYTKSRINSFVDDYGWGFIYQDSEDRKMYHVVTTYGNYTIENVDSVEEFRVSKGNIGILYDKRHTGHVVNVNGHETLLENFGKIELNATGFLSGVTSTDAFFELNGEKWIAGFTTFSKTKDGSRLYYSDGRVVDSPAVESVHLNEYHTVYTYETQDSPDDQPFTVENGKGFVHFNGTNYGPVKLFTNSIQFEGKNWGFGLSDLENKDGIAVINGQLFESGMTPNVYLSNGSWAIEYSNPETNRVVNVINGLNMGQIDNIASSTSRIGYTKNTSTLGIARKGTLWIDQEKIKDIPEDHLVSKLHLSDTLWAYKFQDGKEYKNYVNAQGVIHGPFKRGPDIQLNNDQIFLWDKAENTLVIGNQTFDSFEKIKFVHVTDNNWYFIHENETGTYFVINENTLGPHSWSEKMYVN